MSVELTTLEVRLHAQRIGTLTRLPDDRTLFAFDPAYVEDSKRPTLSLSYKGQHGELITQANPMLRLPPFFSNLLPEGPLREYLAERAKVKPSREFFLLWALGHDLPGAVTVVSPHGDLPPPDDDGDPVDDGALRFSLAGVQLKFSAVQQARGGLTIRADGTDGSWIVKLPSMQLAGAPEDEFAMMELARKVGIDVPETHLLPIGEIAGLPDGIEVGGEVAFAIRRFDRPEPGQAVHIEDFAQVFAEYPERKYGRASYRDLAEVLWIETGETGVTEFVRRLVFNVLIGNGDMHLKNWSLIYPDQRSAQLAPAYDFVSTIAYLPKDRLALTLSGTKDFNAVTLARFQSLAEAAGLPTKLTLDTVRESVALFAEIWPSFNSAGLTEGLRETLATHLLRIPLWQEITGA